MYTGKYTLLDIRITNAVKFYLPAFISRTASTTAFAW